MIEYDRSEWGGGWAVTATGNRSGDDPPRERVALDRKEAVPRWVSGPV